MREIKFRWVGLNKKFNEIQIQEGLTTKDLLKGSYLSFFSESNRGELLGNCKFLSEDIWSGFKDKNGVDIYEGDIVKMKREYTIPYPIDEPIDVCDILTGEVKIIPSKGVVIYNPECEDLICSSGGGIKKGYFNVVQYKSEVIGNIHENPELIKQ